MVVGAQQVNRNVGTTVTLIKVVGNVASEVGSLTIRLDEHTVLVVSVRGCPQPHGTILIKDLTALAQGFDCGVNCTGIVQRILMEEDIEFRAEIAQTLLDFIEHQLNTTRAECLNGFFFGKRDRIGLSCRDRVFAHLGSDISNVLAAVAIFGGFVSHRTRVERTSEAINLRAVIVEVVLAGDLRPRSLH